MDTRQIGSFGEDAAAEYLRKKGYQINMRNYHCREGEIDIVAQESGETVFAEVKTRRSRAYGEPCEAVGRAKQKKLILAAQKYMLDNNIEGAVRFDVIEVMIVQNRGRYAVRELNHIEHAFE